MKSRVKIVIMALLLTAFTVSMAHADWEVEQIESGPDDGFITETGSKFFGTPWVQVKSSSASLTSYFAFRGVYLPDNITILNASLQFTAPHPVTFSPNATLDVSIYGLKTGDLTSWDPTPDLESEPFTIAVTNWDATPLSNDVQINVTVTDQVIEIYELNAWRPGNGMGFRVVSERALSGLANRYQEAYESDPNDAMKLYVEYTGANATTTYYKEYTVVNDIVGTGAVLTYNDITDSEVLLLTADVFDYQARTIRLENNLEGPDSVVSVGEHIYYISKNLANPWNISLFRTIDRGLTFTNMGEISSSPGSSQIADIGAVAYDNNNTIYIAYGQGFDTYVRNFTVSNQAMSAGSMIYNGAFNIQEHRTYWDEVHDTIWVTMYGGDPGSSQREPVVIRKENGGSWENYRYSAFGDARDNDVVWSDGTMYWAIFDYDVVESGRRHKLLYLSNYSDLTNWTLLGQTNNRVIGGAWDLGDTGSDPVIAFERKDGAGFIYRHIYQYRWVGGPGGSWDANIYNWTGFAPNPQPHGHSAKYYYQRSGELWLVTIFHGSGGSVITYNDWNYFTTMHSVPGAVSMKSSGHELNNLGGDQFPFSAGQNSFTVYDPNGTLVNSTCIQAATTIEEVQACIDAIPGVGQTPDDPTPPGTNWPEDGFGELTRFNMRFIIWAVGWFLIIAPLIIMAVKPWPMKIYLIFIICITLGFALQWSIGSI